MPFRQDITMTYTVTLGQLIHNKPKQNYVTVTHKGKNIHLKV